ncbi:MAG: ACT domain-containing protein [Albidovulum sp.]
MATVAQSDLGVLLQSMRPKLFDAEYGFAVLADGQALPPGFAPFATVAEAEGQTVIAPAGDLAAADIAFTGGWARISLSVHSDLEAVGLTAAISAALGKAGISANVIAGYFHDHVFVQWPRRAEAMRVLADLSGRR